MNNSDTRKRLTVVFIYLLAVLSGLFVVMRYMQVTSDMSAFLPHGATSAQEIIFKQFKQAANSRAIMIGIEGSDQQELIEVNKKISRTLKNSGLFSVVNNGQSEIPRREAQLLFDNRFVLNTENDYGKYNSKALRASLENKLAELSSNLSPLLKKLLPRDPAGDFDRVLSNLQNDVEVYKRDGIFFSKDNKRSLILVIPDAQSTNLNQQQIAIDEINAAFAGSKKAGTKLLIAGPVLIALSAREKIRSDVRVLSLSATFIVIGFLFFAFRSIRIVLLSAVPLASGMLAGIVATTVLFESVHGITIAFGATLIGIAVDYPMHFFSHLDGKRTPLESVSNIWGTLRLSVLTTIIGFSSLLFSGYSGLSQLAVFSIFGVVAAVLTTRYLLPAVMTKNFNSALALPELHSLIKNLANKAGKLWPAFILLLAVSMTVLAVKKNDIWNDNLSALSPATQAQLSINKMMGDDLNIKVANELIITTADSQESVLQSVETLTKKLDGLSGNKIFGSYESVVKYLPSIKTQKKKLEELPDTNILQKNINLAAHGLPFRKNLFQPFINDVEKARNQLPVTMESFSGTVLADKVSPLLFKTNNIWASTVLLYDVLEPEKLMRLVNTGADSGNWIYINRSKEIRKTMVEYRQRALGVFVFGVLAILCVLWIGIGSLRTAIGIIGIPFSVLVVDSVILSLLGIQLTLFHLVAMLLVAGLGIDYALFFNRIRTNENEWTTSFPAIWKSWLTTVFVFGCLALSDTAVLRALGITVTLGVTLSFIFGLIWTRRFSSPAGSL